MKKRLIAAIAGAMALCMAAAGCAGTQTGTTTAADPAESTAAATTAAPAEASDSAAADTTAAAEEEWRNMDDAYLSGNVCGDLVDLPDRYDHLEVEVQNPEEVTDEDVENNIEATLQTNVPLKEVDRKVEEGDTVSIDYVGKLDGVEFEGGTGSYDLVIGSHSFIEGFEEGLIGAEKGETRNLELTFPEEYSAADLAGKDVIFTVTVNKISESEVPDLDDDYVRSLNKVDKFNNAITTVDDYKEYVRANISEEREATYRDSVIAACLSKLLEESTFKAEIPANLQEQYKDSMTRMLQYYALMSYVELKDLMINAYHATEDNYMEMIDDMAVEQMKRDIILQAIADKEDLNPDEEDVSKAVAGYVESEDTIKSADDVPRYAKEFLRDELMRNSVYEWLVDHCKVEEPSEEEKADDAGESTDADADGNTAASAEEEDDAASAGETADAASTGETADAAEDR